MTGWIEIAVADGGFATSIAAVRGKLSQPSAARELPPRLMKMMEYSRCFTCRFADTSVRKSSKESAEAVAKLAAGEQVCDTCTVAMQHGVASLSSHGMAGSPHTHKVRWMRGGVRGRADSSGGHCR